MSPTTDPDDDGAVIVALGNRNAVEVIPDPDDAEAAAADNRPINRERRPLKGKLCTTVRIPAGVKTLEALTNITAAGGVWANHSDAEAPAWVASTDPRLAELLAEHYGCELRDYEPSEG